MSNLESKVAVITGGSTGIGLASAKEFIKAGATVVLFARTRKDLDTAESDLDPNSYVIGGDVTRLGDLDRLYSETKSKFGGIDVLFINSAQGKLVPIADTTKSIYDEMIDCHIPVVLLTAKADKRSKIEGLQTGADDYLSNPFSTEKL